MPSGNELLSRVAERRTSVCNLSPTKDGINPYPQFSAVFFDKHENLKHYTLAFSSTYEGVGEGGGGGEEVHS